MSHGTTNECYALVRETKDIYTVKRVDRSTIRAGGNIAIRRELVRRLRTRNGKGFHKVNIADCRLSRERDYVITLPS